MIIKFRYCHALLVWPAITRADLTTVMVLYCGYGFVAPASHWMDLTVKNLSKLTELSDLDRIPLYLARSREFRDASFHHGCDFIAPLELQIKL
jgi:hypothetical protein